MYYRVAMQADLSSTWQWKSMVLNSLQDLFQVLRLYGSVGKKLDHLRVFSSSSREELNEQLKQENLGLGSLSDTAVHFLQERLIDTPEVKQGTPASEGGADHRWQPSLMEAIAARSRPPVKESSREGNCPGATGMSALERRRLEMEWGAGDDHDVPYRFALSPSTPQVLAWMRLLVRIQRGELPS